MLCVMYSSLERNLKGRDNSNRINITKGIRITRRYPLPMTMMKSKGLIWKKKMSDVERREIKTGRRRRIRRIRARAKVRRIKVNRASPLCQSTRKLNNQLISMMRILLAKVNDSTHP